MNIDAWTEGLKLINNPSGMIAIIVVTLALTQVIKQLRISNRWMPLVAVGVGLVCGLIIGGLTTTGALFGAVDGILAGCAASGVFNVLTLFTRGE